MQESTQHIYRLPCRAVQVRWGHIYVDAHELGILAIWAGRQGICRLLLRGKGQVCLALLRAFNLTIFFLFRSFPRRVWTQIPALFRHQPKNLKARAHTAGTACTYLSVHGKYIHTYTYRPTTKLIFLICNRTIKFNSFVKNMAWHFFLFCDCTLSYICKYVLLLYLLFQLDKKYFKKLFFIYFVY